MAKGSKKIPDVGVLPDSEKMAGGERVGIKDSGYLTKKGTTGESVNVLPLPPGMNIEDQPTADINPMELKTYGGGLSYPGDGWD